MAPGPNTSLDNRIAHQRLGELLDHAWQHSRFYRELYQSHGISAKDLPDLTVRDLPFVTKEMLMEHFDAAVTDSRLRKEELHRWLEENRNPRDTYRDEFIVVRTSGGSSTIGTFVYDKRAWQIMSSTVAPRLHLGDAAPSVRLRSAFYAVIDRHAGAVTTAVHASRIAHDILPVSFFDPEDEIIKQINAFQPHRLTSYASGVTRLAELALEGRLAVSPQQIVVSGDRLTTQMETKIRAAWNAPIYNVYAAAESFFIAIKTGQEAWMVVDDLNTLEVLNGDQPAAVGERGRAVLTNLFNYTLPIIRYELCDHVIRGPTTHGGTQLLDIEGKTHDVLPVTLDDGERGTIPSYELAAFQVSDVDNVQFVSQQPDYVQLEYRASRQCDGRVRSEFRRFLDQHGACRTTFDVRRVDRIWNSARTAKLQLVRQPNEAMLRPQVASALLPVSSSLGRVEPSNTYVEFDSAEIEGSIVRRFEQEAAKSEQRVAVKDGAETLTYDALNRAANRLARVLVGVETVRHEPVALVLDHGLGMIVGILGVLKAGKIYVPLDPSYPQARNALVLEDAGAHLVVTDSAHIAIARGSVSGGCRVINLDDIDPNLSDDNLELASTPDTPACLIYTSGTTGEPKGVVQSHRNILHRVMAYTNDFHISQNDRVSLAHSYTFSASLRDIFGALLNGATLLPYDLKKKGLNNLARWMIDERLTVFYLVPTVFRHFIATLTNEEFPQLRLIRLGGEPVSRRDVEGYQRHFSSDCILVNALATTEAGTIRQYFIDKSTPIVGNRVPVGDAVADKDVVLLDENGHDVGVDAVGEIAVKSRFLASGYWRRSDLTRAAFTPISEDEVTRLHRTGDLGRLLPDQRLIHLGRKDSRVNIRGHRVETAEIEMALLDIGEVRESVVVPHESDDGSHFLVAYVVPTAQPGPSAATLRRVLGKTLPAFMIPLTFVMLTTLPTLPNGKVDRATLPAPGRDRPEQETRFVAPRTEAEQVVAAIWSSVLDIAAVGVYDNFLDLGGDSLRAFRILSRVRDAFGIDVPVGVLFDAPTVASMAAFITLGG